MAITFQRAFPDYLYCTNPWNGTLPVTVACWFRSASLAATYDVLLRFEDATGANQSAIFLAGITASSTLAAASENSAGTIVQGVSSGTFSSNTWTHACGVWASSTSRTAYLQGTAGTTNTTSNTPTAASLTRMAIGAAGISGGGGSFWDGDIAEIGVWNVALTQDEITSLANGFSPLKIRPTALLSYVPMYIGEGAGVSVRDKLSPTSLTALTGTIQSVSHPRVFYPRYDMRARNLY